VTKIWYKFVVTSRDECSLMNKCGFLLRSSPSPYFPSYSITERSDMVLPLSQGFWALYGAAVLWTLCKITSPSPFVGLAVANKSCSGSVTSCPHDSAQWHFKIHCTLKKTVRNGGRASSSGYPRNSKLWRRPSLLHGGHLVGSWS
jgi:hypothetical protein